MTTPKGVKVALLVAAGVPVGAVLGLWLAGLLHMLNDWATYAEQGDQQ